MHRLLLLLTTFFCYLVLPGQSLLRDVVPGNSGSSPLFLGEANQKLFFATGLNYPGYYLPSGLWSTDGTEAGTVKLISIDSTIQRPLNLPYFPTKQAFPILNNRLIFTVKKSNSNWDIYSSDGTIPGTQKFMDFGDSVFQITFGQQDPIILKGSFIFATTNYNGNVYIWKSDGTTIGTKIITKHFSYRFFGQYSGMPYNFAYFKNAAYFISLSDTNTLTLSKVDVTVNGMQALATFPRPNSGATGYIPQVFKDKIYFGISNSRNIGEVWISDGTSAGTKPLQDTPVGPFLDHFGFLTEVGAKAFFVSSDFQRGSELWITDGTVAGTKLVKELLPGFRSGVAAIIGKTSSRVFLLGRDTAKSVFNLYVSDGTEAGTFYLPNTFIPTRLGFDVYAAYISSVTVNDKLFFQNYTDKLFDESEIWVTDGTPSGTSPVINHDSLYITPSIYNPIPLVYFKNKIYFSAGTTLTGGEPHYIDSCLCKPDDNQTISGKLYPNPAFERVLIDIEWSELKAYKKANLLVFDAAGKKVFSHVFAINENCGLLSFETSHLSQGIYFATVLVGNKKFTKRFVVLR